MFFWISHQLIGTRAIHTLNTLYLGLWGSLAVYTNKPFEIERLKNGLEASLLRVS